MAVLLVFTAGIVIGSWACRALNEGQRAELTTYLQGFLRTVDRYAPAGGQVEVLRASLGLNLRTLLAIWLGGALVIGVPLVILLVFGRGFSIGFTVGFLASQSGVKGVLFALGAVLPHNLLAVPAVFVGAIASLSFAGKVWENRRRRSSSLAPDVAAYLALGITLACLLGLASAVEAYVSPALVKLLRPLLG